MDVAIRPYTEADFDAVTSLWLDSWKSSGIEVAQTTTLSTLRERLPREIAHGWAVHVATAPDVVGFLGLHENEVEQLFVSPAMQGNGIGRRLLDFAKAQKPAGFSLHTAVECEAAWRFYEREGLKRGGTFIHPRLHHQVVQYDWDP